MINISFQSVCRCWRVTKADLISGGKHYHQILKFSKVTHWTFAPLPQQGVSQLPSALAGSFSRSTEL